MNFDTIWHKQLRRPYQLYTEQHGISSNPHLVLLHGIAASSDDWSFIVERLAGDYYCITIDLLGFAKSPKPQWNNYAMEDHLRSIEHTIRRLSIRDGFILAGHSLGSLLATRYALKHPRQVSRLLLLSPPVYPPLRDISRRSAYVRTNLLLKIYRFLRSNPRLTLAKLNKLSYIVPIPRSIVKNPETWVPFRRSLERCIEQQTIQADITSIRVPIDVFYGNLDAVVVPSNVETLASTHTVRLHSFRGNHTMGRNYARAVQQVLTHETHTARKSQR